ncbi:hypothetical protein GCM10010378_20320 [Streptomyces viridochromogenes]
MSIRRGRPPPGVLSVCFDAVSATPPILPRPTDSRAPPGCRPDAPGTVRGPNTRSPQGRFRVRGSET